MIRKKIEIDSDSDPTLILRRLQDECTAAGLSREDLDALVAEVSDRLGAMIRNGRAVAATDGQYRATKRIETACATIVLDARFGMRPSFWSRIAHAILPGDKG